MGRSATRPGALQAPTTPEFQHSIPNAAIWPARSRKKGVPAPPSAGVARPPQTPTPILFLLLLSSLLVGVEAARPSAHPKSRLSCWAKQPNRHNQALDSPQLSLHRPAANATFRVSPR